MRVGQIALVNLTALAFLITGCGESAEVRIEKAQIAYDMMSASLRKLGLRD